MNQSNIKIVKCTGIFKSYTFYCWNEYIVHIIYSSWGYVFFQQQITKKLYYHNCQWKNYSIACLKLEISPVRLQARNLVCISFSMEHL